MKILKISHLFILFILISGCSSIPKNTSNSCSIFDERYLWFKHASKSEKKWGTPVYLQLAIIKMESDFDWLAKPPRQKLFKVIPYKRPSSSFGYSQAVNGTWEQYKKETGNKLAVRTMDTTANEMKRVLELQKQLKECSSSLSRNKYIIF